MIKINERTFKWSDNMNLYDVFKQAGYNLRQPSVLVHVNGSVVKKDQWEKINIQDESVIEIVNLLRGG